METAPYNEQVLLVTETNGLVQYVVATHKDIDGVDMWVAHTIGGHKGRVEYRFCDCDVSYNLVVTIPHPVAWLRIPGWIMIEDDDETPTLN